MSKSLKHGNLMRFVDKMGDGFERLAHLPIMPSARMWLYVAVSCLMLSSLVMVTSASMPFAIEKGLHPLKFFWSQLGYMLIATGVGVVVYQFISLKSWYNHKVIWTVFLVMVVLLLITLLTTRINGSKRWLSFLGFSFQPAEFVKMFMVVIVAEYAYRFSGHIRDSLFKAFSLTVFYGPVLALLLLQPDFGSTVVLSGTMLAMFFAMGVPLIHFSCLTAILAISGAILVATSEYRLRRITGFLDPFDDPIDSDYQLLRSLVAFARGELTGVGYGNSIQKYDHLPEAHTDFLLAVTGEELGFLGVLLIIVLEFIVVFAIMRIGYLTLMRNQLKLGYTTFGFGVLIFGHLLINASMNLGLLPTKGLTMPFFSYGGSSMLFSVIMIALVLKIDRESPRIAKAGQSSEY